MPNRIVPVLRIIHHNKQLFIDLLEKLFLKALRQTGEESVASRKQYTHIQLSPDVHIAIANRLMHEVVEAGRRVTLHNERRHEDRFRSHKARRVNIEQLAIWQVVRHKEIVALLRQSVVLFRVEGNEAQLFLQKHTNGLLP